MEENKTYYKQSGKFSPAGAVLMLLATAVCGVALFWVYMLFNGWCTIIYLNIFAALAVSVALGYVGGKIVKAFKMRNTLVAMICTIVGFLIATYFKWALYDYNDLKKYGYDLMKDQSAWEYYIELSTMFEDTDSDSFEEYYDFYHELNAYDFFSYDGDDSDFTAKDIEDMKKQSVWEFLEFDKLLGKNLETAKESLSKSKTMNAYDYTYEYKTGYEKIGFFDILTSPSDLWNDIKGINEEGRWSFKSSHSSRDNGTLVNGTILWIVWGGELIALAAFLFASVYQKSKEPFIESEDEWAEYKDTKSVFKFYAPANAKQFKAEMEQNPYSLFNYVIDGNQYQTSYMSIECYVSKLGNENYISAYQMTINPKNKNPNSKTLFKYLFVDGDFISRLYSQFTPGNAQKVPHPADEQQASAEPQTEEQNV